MFSQLACVSSGVSQGSILGPLLFLIYINDMSQAIKSNLFLYADDTCLVCQQKDINEIKKRLNKNFESICDRFVDNKLSIHFGNDKTKSILFATKFNIKKVRKLNIKYGNIQIKRDSKVKYLGCMLQSGAKIVRLIVKKELSGSPSPNINVGYEFKGVGQA